MVVILEMTAMMMTITRAIVVLMDLLVMIDINDYCDNHHQNNGVAVTRATVVLMDLLVMMEMNDFDDDHHQTGGLIRMPLW